MKNKQNQEQLPPTMYYNGISELAPASQKQVNARIDMNKNAI